MTASAETNLPGNVSNIIEQMCAQSMEVMLTK
jgi:hypothetical protein